MLAQYEDGSGQRLELQTSLGVTAEDREQGMDTYVLVTETGVVHYGGVTHWSLASNELQLDLSDDDASAAATFSTES